MKLRHLTLSVGLALGLTSSCLRPTEDRAERDLTVGQAELGALRVQVTDGLAAVRSLTEGELVLWGSAPSFELVLQSSRRQRLELEVQNCLPEAELASADGSAPVLALAPTQAPTRKRW